MAKHTQDPDGLIDTWLTRHGFRYNPYKHLDAAADEHLSEYIVEHETVRFALDDTHAIIYAQPGGGKTATRIAAEQTFWVGSGRYHTFPISYVLNNEFNSGIPPSAIHHEQKLIHAAATALIVGFAYRPYLYLDLADSDKHIVRQHLQDNLPSLDYYLDILRSNGKPLVLSRMIQRSSSRILDGHPKGLMALCSELSERNERTTAFRNLSETVDLLLDITGFRAISIMVDAVDGFFETSNNSGIATAWLRPLIEMAQKANSKTSFKFFLPQELSEPIDLELYDLAPHPVSSTLRWTPALLKEMLNLRTRAATGDAIDSLQAIAAAGVIDLEDEIIDHTAPLPREVIELTRRVLSECAGHGSTRLIQLEDVARAVRKYRNQPATRAIEDRREGLQV